MQAGPLPATALAHSRQNIFSNQRSHGRLHCICAPVPLHEPTAPLQYVDHITFQSLDLWRSTSYRGTGNGRHAAVRLYLVPKQEYRRNQQGLVMSDVKGNHPMGHGSMAAALVVLSAAVVNGSRRDDQHSQSCGGSGYSGVR